MSIGDDGLTTEQRHWIARMNAVGVLYRRSLWLTYLACAFVFLMGMSTSKDVSLLGAIDVDRLKMLAYMPMLLAYLIQVNAGCASGKLAARRNAGLLSDAVAERYDTSPNPSDLMPYREDDWSIGEKPVRYLIAILLPVYLMVAGYIQHTLFYPFPVSYPFRVAVCVVFALPMTLAWQQLWRLTAVIKRIKTDQRGRPIIPVPVDLQRHVVPRQERSGLPD